MKKIICILMLLCATVSFAQKGTWNDKTRDAAYEAPNSLLQKTWYNSADKKSRYVFQANGTFNDISEIRNKEYGVGITGNQYGRYSRNKDRIIVTYLGTKITLNQQDLAKLSARERDELTRFWKKAEAERTSDIKNKKDYFLILRLDNECMILTNYSPSSGMFNDISWSTYYNEKGLAENQKREAIAKAEAARQDSIARVERARQDSIAKVEEAIRDSIAKVEEAIRDSIENAKVYDVVEQMPQYKGGDQALMDYIDKNLKYPVIAKENGIQGRVVCTFIVERDGSISEVKVVRSVDPSLDEEAVRLLKSMPEWIPGKQKGVLVRTKFMLPVSFKL